MFVLCTSKVGVRLLTLCVAPGTSPKIESSASNWLRKPTNDGCSATSSPPREKRTRLSFVGRFLRGLISLHPAAMFPKVHLSSLVSVVDGSTDPSLVRQYPFVFVV